MSARAGRVLPPDHRYRVGARLNLGIALQSQGRAADAEKELREAMQEMERTLGPEHATTLNCRTSLARALMDLKRYDEARPLAESALKGLQQRYGAGHWFTKMAAGTMIRFYEETNQLDQAGVMRKEYDLPASPPTTQPAGASNG
jgi:tetratricopeptide (TPR) repeat protein